MSPIQSRQVLVSNRWVRLVRKDVLEQDLVQDYYILETGDSSVVVARTPSGQIPLVRQFRPALERYTLEVPAGWVEPHETPDQACRRELKEEAGLHVLSLRRLRSYPIDTGRHSNQQHAFYAEASEPDPDFAVEAGLELLFVTVEELYQLYQDEKIDNPTPVAAAFLAGVLGPIPAFRTL